MERSENSICPSVSGEIPTKSFWHLGGKEPGWGITALGNSSVTLDKSLGLILLMSNPGRCYYRTPSGPAPIILLPITGSTPWWCPPE